MGVRIQFNIQNLLLIVPLAKKDKSKPFINRSFSGKMLIKLKKPSKPNNFQFPDMEIN